MGQCAETYKVKLLEKSEYSSLVTFLLAQRDVVNFLFLLGI